MKIYAASDLHGQLPPMGQLPEGAVALLAGDLCHDFIGLRNTVISLQREWLDTDFRRWLAEGEEKGVEVIAIPGNHDFVFQASAHLLLNLPDNFTLLRDNCHWHEEIGQIMGTPWSLCPEGWAYRLRDDHQLQEILHYTLPVNQINLWLIHQPPFGPAGVAPSGVNLGSELVHRIAVDRCIPVVICGHIHSGAGLYEPHRQRPYLLVNAAVCNENNERVRDWIEVEIGDSHGTRGTSARPSLGDVGGPQL